MQLGENQHDSLKLFGEGWCFRDCRGHLNVATKHIGLATKRAHDRDFISQGESCILCGMTNLSLCFVAFGFYLLC